jgi:hypothetical protein
MNHPDAGQALQLLEKSRAALQAEVTKLATRRQELQAKLEALGGQLKEVDVELEAKRRMLGLVEATAQDFGRQQAALSSAGSRVGPRTCPWRLAAPIHPFLMSSRSRFPSRALPVAVWEDHLLPLLTCKDAARLGCTCKAH